jgi:pre-mRNA-splicing factor CDC5/CEF1
VLQAEFDAVRKEMEKEAKRAAKLEQKAGLVTGGLTKRQQKLLGETDEAWAALQSAATELECFRCVVWCCGGRH